jgi:hypothetical protein
MLEDTVIKMIRSTKGSLEELESTAGENLTTRQLQSLRGNCMRHRSVVKALQWALRESKERQTHPR